MIDVEVMTKTPCRLGESPVWSSGSETLFWVDIAAKQLHCHRAGAARSWQFDELVAAVAPCDTTDRVVLALAQRVVLFDLGSETVTELCRPDLNPQNRANDARCDARGRLWLGTMQNNLNAEGEGTAVIQSSGGVFCIVSAGSATQKLSGIGITNGIGWSPDNHTMYVADSLANRICAFDFDVATGNVNNHRIFHEGFERGVPDGATVDAEGYVWSARFGGNCLVRHTPNGNIDRLIELPVSNPTSCTFGGDGLATLFVTSATLGLSDEQLRRNAFEGNVLKLDVGVSGARHEHFTSG